jgi:phage terminase large subunit
MSNMVIKFPKVYRELDDPYRYKVLYGGRAAARSWTIARKLLLRGTQRPEFILCTRELQKTIKQSVHRLLKKQIQMLGLNAFYTVTDTSIKGINGTEFMFLGTKANPEEIRSTEGITICWIEEGHSLTESSWDIIDPTVREEGSEIWISFNTRFKYDHIYKTFVVDKSMNNALVIKTSSEDNPYLSTVLKDQREALKEADYEKYLHVWEGELKQLAEGAIFGKQITEVKRSGRLTFVPVQKNCEVDTYFDLGKNDETAIWFIQSIGLEYRLIDYFQGRLEEIDYYTRFIKNVGYNYGYHYLPHDADHDRLGMTRNIREQFEDGGVSPTIIVPRIPVKTTAIQLAREIFTNCWFHLGNDGDRPASECEGYIELDDESMNTRAKRMEKGLEVLSNYQYKYRDSDDVYQANPLHNRASNGADAFQCFAQADKDYEYEYEEYEEDYEDGGNNITGY